MSDIRQKAIDGLAPGDSFSITRTFRREDTEAFGTLTRDYNPVHFDRRFARSKGLDGLICHGLLTGSMVSQIGGQLGLLATQMSFAFKRPVYFGDTITCALVLTRIADRGRSHFEATLTNQRGEVVATATLTGLLPRSADRAVLAEMVAEGDPTNPLR